MRHKLIRQPVRFSSQGDLDMPAGPAPQLGQHTAAILAELGYSAGEIEALAGSGVAR